MATFGLIVYSKKYGNCETQKWWQEMTNAMVQYFADNKPAYDREVAFVECRNFNRDLFPEMYALKITTDPTLIIYRIIGADTYAAAKLVGSQINQRNIVRMMREVAGLQLAPEGDVLYNPETDPLIRIGQRKDLAPGGGLIAAPSLLGPETNLDFDGGLLQKLLGYAALGWLGWMIFSEENKK